MAKIGNEAKLILKLACERMKHSMKQSLSSEKAWRTDPGNHPENRSYVDGIETGYFKAVNDYQKILDRVVEEMESK